MSVVAALVVAVAVPVSARQVAIAASLVFDAVTVVDVEQGKLLQNQRVVIAGNRIQAMGSSRSVTIPKDARVVDARGKYLIPGLWDLHTHSMDATDRFYPLFIANGITGIRDAGSLIPLDSLVQWRREIVAGRRVGPPRQILSGPMIQDKILGSRACTPPHLFVCVSASDSTGIQRLVDSLRIGGADMLKLRFIVTKDTYFAAAGEARRFGIPFGGHVNQPLTALEVSDSGATIIDHPSAAGLEPCLGRRANVAWCRTLAERFRHNGTWWVATLLVDPSNLGADAAAIAVRLREITEKFWAGSSYHGDWLHDLGITADSLGFLRVVQSVGIPMLAGTDVAPSTGGVRGGSPVMDAPGFSLHAELASYVSEGATPLKALQSATLHPAQMLHATDSLGTVGPGKLADLVLLDADPLAHITSTTTIRAVVANGRYFDRAALDQLLVMVRTRARKQHS